MEEEIRTLKVHGIDLVTLDEEYDILILPENAEAHGELIDADDAVLLSKYLKQEGVRCGNSQDVGIHCHTLDRRSSDIWLGLTWILDSVALPVLVGVLANMLSVKGKSKQSTVHAKLRWRAKEGGLERLDWHGSGDTLVELMKVISEHSEKDET